mmetsp:Transcript_23806/g.27606  ORF Transcript_23806/g.27606 Transcript_23806/m.27606 type:complete len:81 (-) Transcript_23806:16-258(-)
MKLLEGVETASPSCRSFATEHLCSRTALRVQQQQPTSHRSFEEQSTSVVKVFKRKGDGTKRNAKNDVDWGYDDERKIKGF